MKTDELSGRELNAAVAIALGETCGLPMSKINDDFKPSTQWPDGGPIIDMARISIEFYGTHWGAMPNDEHGCEIADSDHEKHVQMASGWCPVMATGETALVAAMRAFVKMKLGDTVVLS